ncbi:MAG: small multi-drug export protein [Ruminococcaceae bacterium]|nr:small multi-drug export protein [Oscillospiraceae bacterium]
MVETVVEFLREYVSAELVVFIISLLPILELRGGLVAAAIVGIEWYVALPICIIGNMLPIPFVLLFIRKIFEWLKKFKFMKKIVEKLDERAKKKSESINKFILWGLFTFVAIPLPGTGAWTGALVADILDVRFKKAFPIIFVGVVTAGLIVSLVSYGIPWLISLFA